MLFVEMSNVEIDVRGFGLQHLRENGPADNIARGKLGVWMVFGHKGFAFGIPQNRSFAAERFAD